MASSQATVNADDVANAFVKRYYEVLKEHPTMLIRFFRDESTFLHGQEGDQTAVDHGIEAITKSIGNIEFSDSTFTVLRVDGQATVGGSFLVNVLGALRHANETRPFVQTFVLAPQEVGFYVHNYVFRSFREASAESKRGGKGKAKGAQKAEQAADADAGAAHPSPATSPAPEHKAPAAAPAPATAPAHVSPAPAAAHEHNKAHTHEHKTHEAKPAAAAAPAPAVAAPAPAAAHEHNKAHAHEHKTHEAKPAAAAAPAPAPAAAPAAKGTFSYAAALAVPGKPAAAPVPKKAAPKPAAAPADGGKPAASSPSNARKDGASALCIKNIPFSATEEQFLAEIAKHAKVKNVVMKKGFAFLDLESEEAVQKLLDQAVASPIMLNDRALIVERRVGDGPTPARKEGGGKPREGPKEGGRGGGRGGGAAGGPRPAK